MKRRIGIAALLLLALLLAGCRSTPPKNGIFTLNGERPDVDTPYILLDDEEFTYVGQIAASYQPSGWAIQEGNRLILRGNYAGEDFRLVFRVQDENTLTFRAQDSLTPEGMFALSDKDKYLYWEG